MNKAHNTDMARQLNRLRVDNEGRRFRVGNTIRSEDGSLVLVVRSVDTHGNIMLLTPYGQPGYNNEA